MINGSPEWSGRTSEGLLLCGGRGEGRDGVERVVEGDESPPLRIVDLAGVDPAGVLEDLQDPLRVGRLLGPEIQDLGYDAVPEGSGVPPDEVEEADGQGLHGRRPPRREMPRLLIGSMHPGLKTVRRAAERTSPKKIFERKGASWLMKSIPTVTEETRQEL